MEHIHRLFLRDLQVFCLSNYLSEMIESYFGDGKMGVKIKYIQEQPLGTAGALCYLKKNINVPLL